MKQVIQTAFGFFLLSLYSNYTHVYFAVGVTSIMAQNSTYLWTTSTHTMPTLQNNSLEIPISVDELLDHHRHL